MKFIHDLKNISKMKFKVLLILSCFYFTSCSDAFLDTFHQEEVEAFLTKSTWQKKNFWINQESIVFEMELNFRTNNTFAMEAKVLGKRNTSFKTFLWSGTWAYLPLTEELVLTYETDFGLIGYYLEVPMEKEIFQLKLDAETLSLKNVTQKQFFDLALQLD